MYKADGTCVLAHQLSVGDTLRCATGAATVVDIEHNSDSTQVNVYDFTIDKTHNYCLSGGVSVSNSKRLGTLESSALVGHDAFDFLTQDAKLIRGQSNADFWRSIRTGQIPVVPG